MEKWEYKSLEWIHRVREEDYNETKTLSPKELIDKTRKAGSILQIGPDILTVLQGLNA